MRTYTFTRPFCRPRCAARFLAAALIVLIALIATPGRIRAEEAAPEPAPPSTLQVVDPFGAIEAEAAATVVDPFETTASDTPIEASAYVPPRTRWDAKPANFEGPAISTSQPGSEAAPQAGAATAKDPCAAAQFKPLCELGIGIGQPSGQAPTDFATACWEQINAGPNGACRCWPVLCFQWDATCLCYQPLYFEEINAERYGYVCNNCCCCCGCMPGNCMQSAASAAHFFGTIPCLPYCLSAECPTDCVYTLGHYRPGSCPPWRWHWPPCDPYAAATCAGVYTGLIFAIP